MLLVVNGFLLVLVLGHENASAQLQERARAEIVQVLEYNGIRLNPEQLPREMDLPPQSVTARDLAAERAGMEALLGAVEVEERGNLVRYTGQRGGASLYANGEFSVSLAPGAYPAGADQRASVGLECLRLMGFEAAAYGEDREGGTLSAWQTWAGAPIYNCGALLTFEGGELRRMEGFRLTGSGQPAERENTLSVNTVLMRFLAYLNNSGTICNEITSFTEGYVLEGSMPENATLNPVWRVAITTDTASDQRPYLIDAETGAVSFAPRES